MEINMCCSKGLSRPGWKVIKGCVAVVLKLCAEVPTCRPPTGATRGVSASQGDSDVGWLDSTYKPRWLTVSTAPTLHSSQ